MPIYKTLAYLVVLWNLSNEFCVETRDIKRQNSTPLGSSRSKYKGNCFCLSRFNDQFACDRNVLLYSSVATHDTST